MVAIGGRPSLSSTLMPIQLRQSASIVLFSANRMSELGTCTAYIRLYTGSPTQCSWRHRGIPGFTNRFRNVRFPDREPMRLNSTTRVRAGPPQWRLWTASALAGFTFDRSLFGLWPRRLLLELPQVSISEASSRSRRLSIDCISRLQTTSKS